MVQNPNNRDGRSPHVATTHWSVVLAAGKSGSPDATDALETLCRAYWYPLFAYARRRGSSPHDAEDSVQGFFERLVSKEVLGNVEREGGRFRAFLLTCFNRYLSDERDRSRRQKRGGGKDTLSIDARDAEERYQLEPVDFADPVKVFERRWALTVLDRALLRLKDKLGAEGRADIFEHLQGLIVADAGTARHADIAARLGMSPGTVAVTVHRLRQTYRQFLRDEILQTLGRTEEVEDELRHLLSVLRS